MEMKGIMLIHQIPSGEQLPVKIIRSIVHEQITAL